MSSRAMDEFTEKTIRRSAFSLACAILGKATIYYKETFNGNCPTESEITNFCLKIMQSYDCQQISINSTQVQEWIVKTWEQVRKERH